MKIESELLRVDRSSVYREYMRWPELARLGASVKLKTEVGNLDRVFLVGVGGSAAAGDIVAGWASTKKDVELLVFKGYVPVKDMRNTLVIACSASGNTLETINMAREAVERKAKIVLMSSGGKLEEMSRKWKVEHVPMPKTIAPRYALPFNITAITKIVSEVYSIESNSEIDDALSCMRKERNKLSPDKKEPRNRAIALAKLILGKVPKIYGSRITRGVAIRFKNSLNENAKKHACSETMPELFHNEVEAWEGESSSFVPFILRHSMEKKDEKSRIDRLVSLLCNVSAPIELRGEGRTSLAELMTLTYLLDFVSYYAAILSGTDPYPTKMIDKMRG